MNETTWENVSELPPPGNMMGNGSEEARAAFVRLGNGIFTTVRDQIVRRFGGISKELRVLDFGCGHGRVALPFYHAHEKPTNCCDVNPKSIEYLARTRWRSADKNPFC